MHVALSTASEKNVVFLLQISQLLYTLAFVPLINIKMPTIFNIYKQSKFHAHSSWVWKKFYHLEARLKMHEGLDGV